MEEEKDKEISEKFVKSEKELIDIVFNNMDLLVKTVKLPAIEKVYKEKELVRGLFEATERVPIKYKNGVIIPRVDLLIQHKNKNKATIIEVKVYKNITDLTKGLGQLLFYQEFLKKVAKDITKVKVILISDKIPVDDVLAQVSKKNNLAIEFVEWSDKGIKVLEPVDLGGRPEIWKSRETLAKAIDHYFEKEQKPTLSGLAYALGMSRETFNKYGEKGKFSDIIKKGHNRVEKEYEQKLVYENNPTGVIFALKNMGWSDNVKTDWTTKGKELILNLTSYGGAEKK